MYINCNDLLIELIVIMIYELFIVFYIYNVLMNVMCVYIQLSKSKKFRLEQDQQERKFATNKKNRRQKYLFILYLEIVGKKNDWLQKKS